MPRKYSYIPVAVRFWLKVDQSGDCWLWTASQRGDGYGQFDHRQAHRVAYELTYGPIPEGMVVCHRCDVRACCRPSHLFLGTQAENVRDAVRKGRMYCHARSHPEEMARGERTGGARLAEHDVRAIRQRYAAGGVSMRQLAREYGVCFAAIGHIISRRNWKHID